MPRDDGTTRTVSDWRDEVLDQFYHLLQSKESRCAISRCRCALDYSRMSRWERGICHGVSEHLLQRSLLEFPALISYFNGRNATYSQKFLNVGADGFYKAASQA